MPTVPLGVILIWTGTNATIPAGWKRVTSLDGKFPKATANLVDPNVTGGSDTHTHTSPTHTHTMVDHTHSGQIGRSSGDFETHGGDNLHGASRDSHEHSYTTNYLYDGSAANAITYAAGSSLPPYSEVIFIEPDTVPAQLVDGIVALFSSGTIPTNWDVCDGNNSTTNLDEKYLRGAAAGQNAGATGGGLTHTHDVSHNHGTINHYHLATEASMGESSDGDRERSNNTSGGGNVCDRGHRHVMQTTNASDTPSTYSATAGSAETVQPAYKKLRAIQNNSGNPSKPRAIIAMWLGDLDLIPSGWFICDGLLSTPDMRGYHLKITKDLAEVEEYGGADVHSHAASNSHTHTAAGSHTHTGYTGGQSPSTTYSTGAASDGAAKPHSHSFLQSITSATSSWNAATIQADGVNNEPAYRTVAFIMFKYETFGGAAILGSALAS